MMRILSIAIVLSISATVHAEPPRTGEEQEPLRYDFDDQLVTGDYPAPTEIFGTVRLRGARTSLITLREHFVPELLKAVENF